MVNVQEAEPNGLINRVAEKLESEEATQMPEWAKHVKTGQSRQRRPQQRNWWNLRQASILRKLYINGPVGTERLRTIYGGKKNRGAKPSRTKKASGKIIRTNLQQLEKAGYIEKTKEGRKITPQGRSLLDKTTLETNKKPKTKKNTKKTTKKTTKKKSKEKQEE